MRPRTILVVGGGIALGIAAYAVLAPSGLQRTRTLEGENARLEARVTSSRAENALLIAEAKAIGDDADPRELERTVREELGLVKSDEHVLVLDADDESERAERP
jgi:cell division protein FtsB